MTMVEYANALLKQLAQTNEKAAAQTAAPKTTAFQSALPLYEKRPITK